jgi:pimeloyl-ACP methyl ester carboxylesterase
MSAALATRDLVVFDQRGTGDSGALKCSALSSLRKPFSTMISDCATQIGTTRGLYTTDDSVADLEALRKALGYTKLVLFGTSYGTKVALRYAAEYPNNVAGLILDSTVTANGPDIFDESTYAAVPRILTQICASGACPGIANPFADLVKVLTRLNRGPVRAIYRDGSGKAVPLTIFSENVQEVLLAGDDDPFLRADFPAAVAAAAHGQYSLLAILVAHVVLGAVVPNSTEDAPLYYDTYCEELPYPWSRTEPSADRLAAALAFAKSQPPGTYGPFNYQTAFAASPAAYCAYWPFASAAPEPTITALPNVPTLIISGADDLRTPTSNAQQVAAMIPDATVVVVPQTGHSVLGTESGSCARNAVNAFFAGTAIDTTCASPALPAYLKPAPAAPSTLASLSPLHGTHGLAGRTVRAFELTLGWSTRELKESYIETLLGSFNPAFFRGLGGLYGGYAKLTTSKKTLQETIVFHHFSYVPGVSITGSITGGIGRLTIGGPHAAAGTLVATTVNRFVGKLGGVAIRFTISRAQAVALTASRAR